MLSIVIPTQNRVEILQKCVQSIVSSDDLSSLQKLIIVDDASTDATPEILYQWQQEGIISAYLRNEKVRGPAASRNAGIKLVQSDYTLIMGDDVVLSPSTLQIFTQYLHDKTPGYFSVIGNIQPVSENTTAFEHWCCYGGSQFCHYRIKEENKYDAGEEYFYTSNIITPTELLQKYPFNESFPYARFEDRELGYRLKRSVSHKIHYLKKAVSHHEHKMPFKTWLVNMEKFTWSSLFFCSLYPQDRELPEKLGIQKALFTRIFDYDFYLYAAEWLNKNHSLYFDQTQINFKQNRSTVSQYFRHLQEFFRMSHFRRHQKLPEMQDVKNHISASTAMKNILNILDDSL